MISITRPRTRTKNMSFDWTKDYEPSEKSEKVYWYDKQDENERKKNVSNFTFFKTKEDLFKDWFLRDLRDKYSDFTKYLTEELEKQGIQYEKEMLKTRYGKEYLFSLLKDFYWIRNIFDLQISDYRDRVFEKELHTVNPEKEKLLQQHREEIHKMEVREKTKEKRDELIRKKKEIEKELKKIYVTNF